ncbi:hypothetical protein D9M72_210340 [compost metagenome]
MTDVGVDRIGPFARQFCDYVAGAVDVVGVIANATNQAVNTGAAVERVVSSTAAERVVGGVARDGVVLSVACAVDGRSAGQRQVLDVRAQGVSHGTLYEVRSFVGQLGNEVARSVDNVGVIACTSEQCVCPCTATEHIGPSVAGQLVVVGASRQVLDVEQRIAA